MLTHWGQVTHMCVSKLTIICSDNGLVPGQCQAIIWTNALILLIWSLGTNFSEILIKIFAFSFKKKHLQISSGIWWPFCLALNVLIEFTAKLMLMKQSYTSFELTDWFLPIWLKIHSYCIIPSILYSDLCLADFIGTSSHFKMDVFHSNDLIAL